MIEAVGLVKQLGDTRVLDGVTFTAPTGEITGLLGPNGAGKTTTMRVLATLLAPDEGTLVIDGVDALADPVEVRRRVGLVTEEPGLFDRLTVREQLTFVGRAHGLATDALADRLDLLADALDLHDALDRRAGVLSKGNRQKAALARALVHDPPVILLDEPTSGLDVMASAGLEELIASEHVRAGKTVLLSTHLLDEAERLCDRVIGIAGGRVVADGPEEHWCRLAGTDDFREAFVRIVGAASLQAPPPPPPPPPSSPPPPSPPRSPR